MKKLLTRLLYEIPSITFEAVVILGFLLLPSFVHTGWRTAAEQRATDAARWSLAHYCTSLHADRQCTNLVLNETLVTRQGINQIAVVHFTYDERPIAFNLEKLDAVQHRNVRIMVARDAPGVLPYIIALDYGVVREDDQTRWLSGFVIGAYMRARAFGVASVLPKDAGK